VNVAEQLRLSLQRLAQPPAGQVALFPSLALVGEELAKDFGAALQAFRATVPELSESQRLALQRLADYLGELSKSQQDAFWIEPVALAVDARWQQVRELAVLALSAFEWSPGVAQAAAAP
jgi:hypothetical protein